MPVESAKAASSVSSSHGVKGRDRYKFESSEFAEDHSTDKLDRYGATLHVKQQHMSKDCPLPAGRWLHSATLMAGSVFIFGGVDAASVRAYRKASQPLGGTGRGGSDVAEGNVVDVTPPKSLAEPMFLEASASTRTRASLQGKERGGKGRYVKSADPVDHLLGDIWSYRLASGYWRRLQADLLPCPDEIPEGSERRKLAYEVPLYRPANVPAGPPVRPDPSGNDGLGEPLSHRYRPGSAEEDAAKKLKGKGGSPAEEAMADLILSMQQQQQGDGSAAPGGGAPAGDSLIRLKASNPSRTYGYSQEGEHALYQWNPSGKSPSASVTPMPSSSPLPPSDLGGAAAAVAPPPSDAADDSMFGNLFGDDADKPLTPPSDPASISSALGGAGTVISTGSTSGEVAVRGGGTGAAGAQSVQSIGPAALAYPVLLQVSEEDAAEGASHRGKTLRKNDKPGFFSRLRSWLTFPKSGVADSHSGSSSSSSSDTVFLEKEGRRGGTSPQDDASVFHQNGGSGASVGAPASNSIAAETARAASEKSAAEMRQRFDRYQSVLGLEIHSSHAEFLSERSAIGEALSGEEAAKKEQQIDEALLTLNAMDAAAAAAAGAGDEGEDMKADSPEAVLLELRSTRMGTLGNNDGGPLNLAAGASDPDGLLVPQSLSSSSSSSSTSSKLGGGEKRRSMAEEIEGGATADSQSKQNPSFLSLHDGPVDATTTNLPLGTSSPGTTGDAPAQTAATPTAATDASTDASAAADATAASAALPIVLPPALDSSAPLSSNASAAAPLLQQQQSPAQAQKKRSYAIQDAPLPFLTREAILADREATLDKWNHERLYYSGYARLEVPTRSRPELGWTALPNWMTPSASKTQTSIYRRVIYTPADALWQYDLSSRRWFQPASLPRPSTRVPVQLIQSGALAAIPVEDASSAYDPAKVTLAKSAAAEALAKASLGTSSYGAKPPSSGAAMGSDVAHLTLLPPEAAPGSLLAYGRTDDSISRDGRATATPSHLPSLQPGDPKRSRTPTPSPTGAPLSGPSLVLRPDLQYPALVPAPRPLDAPSPRWLHSAVAMARGLVVFGGVAAHNLAVEGDVWHFDPEPPMEALPSERNVTATVLAAAVKQATADLASNGLAPTGLSGASMAGSSAPPALLPFSQVPRGQIWRKVWPPPLPFFISNADKPLYGSSSAKPPASGAVFETKARLDSVSAPPFYDPLGPFPSTTGPATPFERTNANLAPPPLEGHSAVVVRHRSTTAAGKRSTKAALPSRNLPPALLSAGKKDPGGLTFAATLFGAMGLPPAGTSENGVGEVMLVFGGIPAAGSAASSSQPDLQASAASASALYGGVQEGVVWAFHVDPEPIWRAHYPSPAPLPGATASTGMGGASFGAKPKAPGVATVPPARWLHSAAAFALQFGVPAAPPKTLPKTAAVSKVPYFEDGMIIFGGCGMDMRPLGDVWIYRYAKNEWKEMLPNGYGPSPRWLAAIASIRPPPMQDHNKKGKGASEAPPSTDSLMQALEKSKNPEAALAVGGASAGGASAGGASAGAKDRAEAASNLVAVTPATEKQSAAVDSAVDAQESTIQNAEQGKKFTKPKVASQIIPAQRLPMFPSKGPSPTPLAPHLSSEHKAIEMAHSHITDMEPSSLPTAQNEWLPSSLSKDEQTLREKMRLDPPSHAQDNERQLNAIKSRADMSGESHALVSPKPKLPATRFIELTSHVRAKGADGGETAEGSGPPPPLSSSPAVALAGSSSPAEPATARLEEDGSQSPSTPDEQEERMPGKEEAEEAQLPAEATEATSPPPTAESGEEEEGVSPVDAAEARFAEAYAEAQAETSTAASRKRDTTAALAAAAAKGENPSSKWSPNSAKNAAKSDEDFNPFRTKIPSFASFPDAAYGLDPAGPGGAIYINGGATSNGVIFGDQFVLHLFVAPPAKKGYMPAAPATASTSTSTKPPLAFPSLVAIWEPLLDMNDGPIAREGAAAIVVTSNPLDSGISGYAEDIDRYNTAAAAQTTTENNERQGKTGLMGAFSRFRSVWDGAGDEGHAASLEQLATAEKQASKPKNITLEALVRQDLKSGGVYNSFVLTPQPAPYSQWILLFGGAQRALPVAIDTKARTEEPPLSALLKRTRAMLIKEEEEIMEV